MKAYQFGTGYRFMAGPPYAGCPVCFSLAGTFSGAVPLLPGLLARHPLLRPSWRSPGRGGRHASSWPATSRRWPAGSRAIAVPNPRRTYPRSR